MVPLRVRRVVWPSTLVYLLRTRLLPGVRDPTLHLLSEPLRLEGPRVVPVSVTSQLHRWRLYRFRDVVPTLRLRFRFPLLLVQLAISEKTRWGQLPPRVRLLLFLFVPVFKATLTKGLSNSGLGKLSVVLQERPCVSRCEWLFSLFSRSLRWCGSKYLNPLPLFRTVEAHDTRPRRSALNVWFFLTKTISRKYLSVLWQ